MLREAGGGAAPDALAAAFSWEAEPGADPGPLLCGRGGGEPPDCSGSSQDFLRQLMNVGGEAPGEGLSQSGAPGPASTAEDRRALQKARQLQEKNKRAQQRYRSRQKEKLEEYRKQVEELSSQVNSLLSEKASLENRTSLLEKVMKMKEEGALAGYGPKCSEVDQEQLLCEEISAFTKLLHEGGSRSLSIDEARRMLRAHPQDMMNLHSDYVKVVSDALVDKTVTDMSSPAYRRLNEIISRARAVMLQVSVVRPRMLKVWELGLPQLPNERWPRILAVLALTPDQRVFLVRIWQTLMARLERVTARRRSVAAALEAAVPAVGDDPTPAACYLQVSQASDELHATLEDEHAAITHFFSEYLSSQGLSVLQEGRALIEAFPHVVNRSKLCRAIAEEGGQALRFPALGPLEEVGESPMWKAEPGAFPGGQNLLAAPGDASLEPMATGMQDVEASRAQTRTLQVLMPSDLGAYCNPSR